MLVNAQILAEGWNAPRATVCMHLAPTASRRVYQQRVGRIMRLHRRKEAGIVVDFAEVGAPHSERVGHAALAARRGRLPARRARHAAAAPAPARAAQAPQADHQGTAVDRAGLGQARAPDRGDREPVEAGGRVQAGPRRAAGVGGHGRSPARPRPTCTRWPSASLNLAPEARELFFFTCAAENRHRRLRLTASATWRLSAPARRPSRWPAGWSRRRRRGTRYPERGSVEARVADSLGVSPAEVLLTNGVDEAIHVLCQAFLDRGDAMLLPVPTYSMYEVYGSEAEAHIDAVLAGDGFGFPLEGIFAAIHERTRVIAIANPNSPTGATVPRDAIIAVAERASQAVVLVDEAYYHFFGETVVDLIGKVPNLVVARTFSKAYGLAGLRLGALIAAEETIHWLRRVISPYSVNQLALLCLPAALEDQAYVDWYVTEVKSARGELAQRLTELGLEHWPSEANFILTRIGPQHGAFVGAMRSRGILTRDRSADPGCDGLVRITVGTREQMRQGRTAIESSLKEIGWRA